ncbi:MAG: TonB family protein [Myxococcota bacterium]
MEEIAIRLDETRRAEFRRFLIASGVLHLIGFGLLAWSPAIPTVSPPAAITIDLSMAPPRPGAKPGPAPTAKPKPKPRKAPVILPTQPNTPKPQAKPRSEPKPAPVEEDEPEEVEYEDLMAQLRADAGEPDPSAKPEPEPVRSAAAGGGGGPGMPVSPELFAWMREARIHVRRSWVVPPAFELDRLVVTIRIDLDAAGNVRGKPKVVTRSGNPWYDENVVRSIEKASPLPAPPAAGPRTFIFHSDRDA